MPSDDDADDMFIMGPGVGAHKSIFLSHRGDVGGDSNSNDSIEVEHSAKLVAKRKRGRAPKKQSKGKDFKEKKQNKEAAAKAKRAESVFIVDDDDDDSSSSEEDATAAGAAATDGASDAEVVDLDAPIVHGAAAKCAARRRKRRMVAELSEDSGSDAPAETEVERRLRATVAAARGAEEEFSDEKVAAEALEEELRKHEQVKQAAAVAAQARELQECEARAAARETDASIIRLSVTCLGSSESLAVRMRGHYKLSKLRPGACAKFKASSDHAVLFHEGHAMLEGETLAFLGITSGSRLEMRISDRPVISLKVRIKGDIVIPSICVRYNDPIVSIHRAVCLKANLAPESASLELDGDTLEPDDTCESLDVESDTLVEARVR
jgi:hypothetical protein